MMVKSRMKKRVRIILLMIAGILIGAPILFSIGTGQGSGWGRMFGWGHEEAAEAQGERAEENGRAGESHAAHALTIVAMGDSLTAGFGVAEAEAYPALLEQKLNADAGGVARYKVVNAGVSGETSSGALSRVKWVLNMKPDIVILETGANDGLRGIDPEVVRKNIGAAVSMFKEHGVTVVLAGMLMSPSLGQKYTSEFAAVYPEVARNHDVILMPFFLDGVASNPAFNLPDGIHPNAAGYRIIADNIHPYVLEAVRLNGYDGHKLK